MCELRCHSSISASRHLDASHQRLVHNNCATPILIPIEHRDLRAISAEDGLAVVSDVQKAVLVLLLLIDLRHQTSSGRKHVVDKDEDSLLGRQLDALADHVHELTDSQISGHEVFLLVDVGEIAASSLLYNHGDSIGVLLPHARCLGLSPLKGKLLPELGLVCLHHYKSCFCTHIHAVRPTGPSSPGAEQSVFDSRCNKKIRPVHFPFPKACCIQVLCTPDDNIFLYSSDNHHRGPNPLLHRFACV
mmetsp:Transcript_32053/g.46827  ORF Transcript_32053/g.46827 Transcript_32053/m.46827 type:complete len:246 (-) Transcript_32053:379-1116(-)